MRHNPISPRGRGVGQSPAARAATRNDRLDIRLCVAAAAVLFALLLGGPGGTTPTAAASNPITAYVPAGLVESAQAQPDADFNVIIQGSPGVGSGAVGNSVDDAIVDIPGRAIGVRRRFASLTGVAAQVSGRQLLLLASRPGISAITPDAPVRLTALSSRQQWPFVSGVAKGWSDVTNGTVGQAPTIAVVDSGVDAARADFGGRVIQQVTLT